MTANPESVHRHDPEVNRAFIALMEAQEGLPKFHVALAVNDPARPAPPAPAEEQTAAHGTVSIAPQVLTFTDLTGDVLKVSAVRGGTDTAEDYLLLTTATADGKEAAAVAVHFARWPQLLSAISAYMAAHRRREDRPRP